MFVKAQILVAVILVAGTLSAGVPGAAPVTNLVFVAFDTETTGFSPKNDRVIEIGAVRFCGDGKIMAATNWLINPCIPVPFHATEVNGITTEMVTRAPNFREVWPAFVAFCENSILLAHNVTFDAGFLRAELDRAGIAPSVQTVVDTLPLFRCWFPQAKSHSLEPLAVYLGVRNENYHRAGTDSLLLISIFNVGMKNHPDLQLSHLERDAGGFVQLAGGKR